jgi:hypothetical protein
MAYSYSRRPCAIKDITSNPKPHASFHPTIPREMHEKEITFFEKVKFSTKANVIISILTLILSCLFI